MKDNLKNMKPYIPGKTVKGAIKLASNENPIGTSPKALEAIKKSLNTINIYPDGYCYELKEKLADKLNVNIDNLLIGNGSDEILQLITAAYLDSGDKVITGIPTFSEYTFATNLFAGEMIYVPLVAGSFDLDAIYNKIDSQTKMIFLCNPNNPTGKHFNGLEKFINSVPKNILVVVDEAYYEYVVAQDYPQTIPLIDRYKNLIILRTFSKIYGLAALRIGYAVANKDIIKTLSIVKQPFNVDTLAQVGATAALDDDQFLKDSLDNNEIGKAYLYKQIDDLGLSYYPTETNFIFIYDLPLAGKDIFEKLMAWGLIIRPMDSFGFTNAIRVTVGKPDENKKFIEMLSKILIN